MKETNSLETQLRSWRPRRPSARLKRRLFGFSFPAGTAWIAGSLAPATVCALLTAGILNMRGGVSYRPAHELVASNLSDVAFTIDGFASPQNHWSSVTFDSTNRSGFGSNAPVFRQ